MATKSIQVAPIEMPLILKWPINRPEAITTANKNIEYAVPMVFVVLRGKYRYSRQNALKGVLYLILGTLEPLGVPVRSVLTLKVVDYSCSLLDYY